MYYFVYIYSIKNNMKYMLHDYMSLRYRRSQIRGTFSRPYHYTDTNSSPAIYLGRWYARSYGVLFFDLVGCGRTTPLPFICLVSHFTSQSASITNNLSDPIENLCTFQTTAIWEINLLQFGYYYYSANRNGYRTFVMIMIRQSYCLWRQRSLAPSSLPITKAPITDV